MIIRRYHAILLGIILLLSGVASYSSYEPLHQSWSRPDISLVPPHPWIALTFDDGPHPVMTEKLMAVLKQEGVPATFFVVGKMAVRHPEIVQDMAREGYEVDNHTFTHPNLSRVDTKTLLSELGQTREVIRRLTGQDTGFFRPPGGNYSKSMLKVVKKAGYHMVLWSVLTKDVSGASAEAMRHRILSKSTDGAIVLMHSGMPKTIEMLPGVIEELRRQGYHFVTVSQMMGHDHLPGGSHPLPLSSRPMYPRADKPAVTFHSHPITPWVSSAG
jgi:peptidoglycan/xylan/chitin deacetylase (PgdA/CDA1 family)